MVVQAQGAGGEGKKTCKEFIQANCNDKFSIKNEKANLVQSDNFNVILFHIFFDYL